MHIFGKMQFVTIAILASQVAWSNCEVIKQLPAQIASPGHYCLDDNHALNMSNGEAIAILADNVLLDLAGFSISNSDGPATMASGITAYQQQDVTVTGGTVRGFRIGVILDGGCVADTTGPYRVVDMNMESNWDSGIDVNACHVLVRGNHVTDTGFGSDSYGVGIEVDGTQVSVIGNDIQGVTERYGFSKGIWFRAVTGVVANNRIQAADQGIVMVGGNVAFRDNMAVEIHDTKYIGGQDAGGNF